MFEFKNRCEEAENEKQRNSQKTLSIENIEIQQKNDIKVGDGA